MLYNIVYRPANSYLLLGNKNIASVSRFFILDGIMTKRTFTIEQHKEIAELYKSGLSSRQLAKIYSVDKSTIMNAVKRYGTAKGMKSFGNQLLTPSEAEQVYKIYQAGYSLNQISIAYGFGKNGRGLSEALKRNGYKLRGGKSLTEKQETEAIKLYESGLSGSQVANELGVSLSPIKKLIASDKVESRKHTTVYKYHVNEDMFSKIDNELSAYVLGFIYADGSVHGNVLRISISEKDTEFLKKIRIAMRCNYPIYYSPRNPNTQSLIKSTTGLVTLQVNNPKLATDLVNAGIVVNRNEFYKTELAMHGSMRSHFIRGYLDGDGCIRGNYNPSVTFVGQLDILEWIRKTFHQELQTNPNLSIPEARNIHYINYCGINQSIKICEWLYCNATIWMKRKKDNFDNWPNPRGKSRKKY